MTASEDATLLQLFTRPDRYFARCGRLCAFIARHEIGGAPTFMRGLRIAVATDFHAIARTSVAHARALADQINALQADLVLLGGDYADRAEHVAPLFEGLAAVRAPLGAFGVLGNNDREAWEDPGPLRRLMAGAGFTLLVNESAKIPLDGGTLVVAGLDDRLRGEPRLMGLYPEKPSQDAYRVLLFHEPTLVSPAPDLTLSGHTHGGQFNLLGLTPYSIGFERLYGRRVRPAAVAGLLDVEGARMLVSKGIGASRIQLRVGVRPEIDLIRFT